MATTGGRTEIARQGRESQRYMCKDGIMHRLVVGVIPYVPSETNDLPVVLLINSRKHPEEWVFPKGGWEDDETSEECGVREAWEESGCIGTIVGELVRDQCIGKMKKEQLHTYYSLEVSAMEDTWPEKSERDRQLICPFKARDMLEQQTRRKDRRIVLEALDKFIQQFSA